MKSLLSRSLKNSLLEISCILETTSDHDPFTLLHKRNPEEDIFPALPPEFVELIYNWGWPFENFYKLKRSAERASSLAEIPHISSILRSVSFLGKGVEAVRIPGDSGICTLIVLGDGGEYSLGIWLGESNPSDPSCYLFVETDYGDNYLEGLYKAPLSDLLGSLKRAAS